MLTDEEKREIDKERALYPQTRAACIEALKTVQRHRGWLSDEVLQDVGEHLGMSFHQLDNVATFYNLLFRRPVGHHVIMVCDSVSCWLTGYESVADRLKQRLGIGFGQTDASRRFTLLPICCLGMCEKAPVLLIDGEPYENLTPERVDDILDGFDKGDS